MGGYTSTKLAKYPSAHWFWTILVDSLAIVGTIVSSFLIHCLLYNVGHSSDCEHFVFAPHVYSAKPNIHACKELG